MTEVQIRPMTLADYAEVRALWLACAGMGLNDVDDSEAGISRFLARNPDTCFAAHQYGRIVGAILTGSDGRRGYIYHTAVHPDFQGRGIGTQLVGHALAALGEIGITKAALVAFKRNQSGNAFWEKQGFTVRDDLVYRNKALRELRRFDT